MTLAVSRKQLTFNLFFVASIFWVIGELYRSANGRMLLMLFSVLCFAVYVLQLLLLLGDWIAGKVRRP